MLLVAFDADLFAKLAPQRLGKPSVLLSMSSRGKQMNEATIKRAARTGDCYGTLPYFLLCHLLYLFQHF